MTGIVSMIDNVLVFDKNQEEQDKHPTVALGKIQRAGMILNKEKCQFFKDWITFLGQIIDGSGVHLDPDKVSAIRKIGTQEYVSDNHRFLGIYNKLSKFVPNLADETKPLRDLLHNECPRTWERPQQDALEKLKRLLSSTPGLAPYDSNARTSVSRCFQSRTWSCATPGVGEWRRKTSFLYFKITVSNGEMVCTDRQRSTGFHLGM